MTDIETSLHPLLLIIGALASIGLFVYLLSKELRGQARWVQVAIMSARALLCLLVWWLIAQPRAVTRDEEVVPVTARLGIDVSGSMELVDQSGEHTTNWTSNGKVDALEQAIALVDAMKIRLNLLTQGLAANRGRLDQEVEGVLEIMRAAERKVASSAKEARFERLLSSPTSSLTKVIEMLEGLDSERALSTLSDCSALAAKVSRELRRVQPLRLDAGTTADNKESRIKLVKAWLKDSRKLFDGMTDDYDLEAVAFAGDLHPLQGLDGIESAKPQGEQTRLYDNLNRLVADDLASGRRISILVTDGVENTKENQSGFSPLVRNEPLLVLAVGDADTTPDLRINRVLHPSNVREKDTFVALVDVAANNTGAVTVRVSLLHEGNVLASQDLELDGEGGNGTASLEWKAEGLGMHDLNVKLEPLADEKNLDNNEQHIKCQVTKDVYRVLVCDLFPRWETRYLLNLFNRDPSIDVDSVVFEPRHAFPGQEEIRPLALPLRLEQWQEYDLVIIGDLSPSQLTQEHQELLVDYVDGGGNLMLLAGQNFMPAAFVDKPLEQMLPMLPVQDEVLEGVFVLAPAGQRQLQPLTQLTPAGSDALWKTIYATMPCYKISQWSKAKASAQVILKANDNSSGQSHDFLAIQRFGGGKVAFAGAPCFYHLRFSHGDRYHLRFWGKLVRGLCIDDFGFDNGLVSTRLDRSLWNSGDEILGRVRIENNEGVPVSEANFDALLTRGDETVARMKPVPDPAREGDYFLRFSDLPPGDYLISYEGDDIQPYLEMDSDRGSSEEGRIFKVEGQPISQELMFATETPDFWDKVNALPLGATVTPATLELMLNAINLEEETYTITRRRSIWDVWILLIAVTVIAGTEWALRRINGLC